MNINRFKFHKLRRRLWDFLSAPKFKRVHELNALTKSLHYNACINTDIL